MATIVVVVADIIRAFITLIMEVDMVVIVVVIKVIFVRIKVIKVTL